MEQAPRSGRLTRTATTARTTSPARPTGHPGTAATPETASVSTVPGARHRRRDPVLMASRSSWRSAVRSPTRTTSSSVAGHARPEPGHRDRSRPSRRRGGRDRAALCGDLTVNEPSGPVLTGRLHQPCRPQAWSPLSRSHRSRSVELMPTRPQEAVSQTEVVLLLCSAIDTAIKYPSGVNDAKDSSRPGLPCSPVGPRPPQPRPALPDWLGARGIYPAMDPGEVGLSPSTPRLTRQDDMTVAEPAAIFYTVTVVRHGCPVAASNEVPP